MTKETSEKVASLAARYIECPNFTLTLNAATIFIYGDDIRILAASCLAQRETVEPSISIARLKKLLSDETTNLVMYALEDLIAEAEKEAAK